MGFGLLIFSLILTALSFVGYAYWVVWPWFSRRRNGLVRAVKVKKKDVIIDPDIQGDFYHEVWWHDKLADGTLRFVVRNRAGEFGKDYPPGTILKEFTGGNRDMWVALSVATPFISDLADLYRQLMDLDKRYEAERDRRIGLENDYKEQLRSMVEHVRNLNKSPAFDPASLMRKP